MNQTVKFGLVLGTICLTATLVLAVTYQVTKPMIEGQLTREEQGALKAIIPGADSFVKKTAGTIEYFDAIKGKELAGYCLRITATGYNGFIHIIAGIDSNGVIAGIEILDQQETPGLGSQINTVRPGESKPWFLKQFVGKSARTIEVHKNIDAITGATISSKAVTDAVREKVTEFLSKVKR